MVEGVAFGAVVVTDVVIRFTAMVGGDRVSHQKLSKRPILKRTDVVSEASLKISCLVVGLKIMYLNDLVCFC